ncbi:4-hydroxy-tetrahydrodipicolinate synthase [Bacillus toyonensis]|uniref:4-hydroxy-tetrahydrodipicolinate synthase n=1 Tax=Bacillus toyonensis TaxID=155322 RepID=UPI002E1F1F15|nr:4-hydroxy-tetrahydrodipicolinate synthase [Bacillus toyonensis]MED2737308.1 4-hydroxy-tetrahydrodipicolinate synthase [Bacillus toyonensis]
MKKDFGKLMTAMVTPFDNNSGLDIASIKKLVKHLEDTGTETIILSGTTGEGPTLTEEEKEILLKEVCEVKNNNTKIIMNVGTNNTLETVNNAVKWSSRLEVDGVMVVCPYYNKPSQKGLYLHFKSVNDAIEKPIMAYHIPGRTNVVMNEETMVKISSLKNITMLKDSEGDLTKLQNVIKRTEDNWSIYCGDDPAIYDYLNIGSVGVVSVASHFIGNDITQMINDFNSNSLETAKERQAFVTLLALGLFPSYAPSPVSAKYMLSQLGFIQETVRLPLTTLDEHERLDTEKVFKVFFK